MDRGRKLFGRVAFPGVLAICLVTAMTLLRGGSDPVVAFLVPVTFATLFVIVTERIYPYARAWSRSHDDIRVDLAHMVSVTLTGALLQPALVAIAIPGAAWISARMGHTIWPADWPLLLQLAVALVVAEFPKYWFHRWMHEHDALWRLHATHHSAPRLYWLNAARFHPADIAIDTTAGMLTLGLLACPADTVSLFALVSTVHGYFQHANLETRIGFLNYFFSMAELHRWHHSRVPAESNNNYGNNVIVWDLVFGTYYRPRDREPDVDIGLTDLPAFPQDFWGQITSPFRWRRIREQSARTGAVDDIAA
jgi:sterol desaturase/sphingolipid hydroxylase (fatty acid hydroxylase superfamily)